MLIWRKSCKICYLECHDTRWLLLRKSAVGWPRYLYICMSEIVPIDWQSVVGDWWKQASQIALFACSFFVCGIR